METSELNNVLQHHDTSLEIDSQERARQPEPEVLLEKPPEREQRWNSQLVE
jgi:hypothetical protein